jgi:hypothetical protein
VSFLAFYTIPYIIFTNKSVIYFGKNKHVFFNICNVSLVWGLIFNKYHLVGWLVSVLLLILPASVAPGTELWKMEGIPSFKELQIPVEWTN